MRQNSINQNTYYQQIKSYENNSKISNNSKNIELKINDYQRESNSNVKVKMDENYDYKRSDRSKSQCSYTKKNNQEYDKNFINNNLDKFKEKNSKRGCDNPEKISKNEAKKNKENIRNKNKKSSSRSDTPNFSKNNLKREKESDNELVFDCIDRVDFSDENLKEKNNKNCNLNRKNNNLKIEETNLNKKNISQEKNIRELKGKSVEPSNLLKKKRKSETNLPNKDVFLN